MYGSPLDVPSSAGERRRDSIRNRRDSRVPLLERHVSDYGEMASESIFDGPISESVPTSQTGFAHRASFSQKQNERTDSDASEGLLSLGFFRSEYDEDRDEDAMSFVTEGDNEEAVDDLESIAESASIASSRRSSGTSRRSLLRRTSQTSSASGLRGPISRTSQKVYLQEEDLFLVIAGFRSSKAKLVLYYAICIVTLGIGYLVFRWLPRLNIRFTGVQCPLNECEWVVVENQWHDVSVHDIIQKPFGAYLSSIFEIGRRTGDPDDDDPLLETVRYLDYRYVRFVWDPSNYRFVLYNNYKDPAWRGTARKCREGLEEDSKTRRLALFGSNLIDIAEKTIPQLLIDEALHPFYVFQIASIILWSCDEYYYYAICIFLISLASIASTVVETKDTMKRLRTMAKFSCDIRVLRNGYWQITESSDLVPGDIFEISDPGINVLPCDALLMSGECVVNESMLTGESVPVAKVQAHDKALHRLANSPTTISAELGRHYLFAGTKLIQVKKPSGSTSEEETALALVTRTGFNTTKGALVRSMLFPKPAGFKFYRDSFRFIGVMGLIAMCGFVVSAINFVKLGMHWSLILVRALDLITIVVPPALPATLTIGTNFAIGRLRKHQIFCISPNRVNVAGKIDVMCFDKTGTLTEDGLDVLGVRTVTPKGFSELLEESSSLTPPDPSQVELSILHVMATCHSLRLIDGELLGDPLDDKMFRFSGWSYEEAGHRSRDRTPRADQAQKPLAKTSSNTISPPIVRGSSGTSDRDVELGIMKQFDFVSQLRRMSVIAKSLESNSMQVYLKGAPEIMSDVCRPDSFPSNYEDILASYTHRGYRVIACAGKSLPGLSWIKAQKMKRDEAEKDLDFLGFIIFENKLKPTTTDALIQLNEARIRSVMCTGDNVLTAISVARECQLLEDTAFVFIPRFLEEGGATNPLQTVIWQNMEGPSVTLDNRTLLPHLSDSDVNLESPFDKHGISNFCLAVTGDVFRWMIDYAPKETLDRMLVKGTVFARMSPDEKAELVEKLQSLDYCVGFCGDGANDCGALKAADVGISLSEAEASVAAPFTSRSFEISCVIRVIKDGRAALVTSFSCFKYMALYSAIQFTTVSLLYRTASNLGDFQFLLIDLALILPIAIFMGRAEPYKKLAIKRPTANLVSKKILGSLLGHIVVIILLQALVYILVQEQSWYIPPVIHKDSPNIENSENTVLFLLSLFQYAFIAIILSVGPPYRQPMYKNTLFMATIVLVTIFTTYVTLYPSAWIASVLQLTYLTWSFKVVILGLAALDIFLSWIGETFVFVQIVKAFAGMKKRALGGNGKKRKLFKTVLEDMRF